jgi:hypothetical protein
MATSPEATAIASLDRALRGPLVGRADARFDDARRVWKGRIDRRPLLIPQCADVPTLIYRPTAIPARSMLSATPSLTGCSVKNDTLILGDNNTATQTTAQCN